MAQPTKQELMAKFHHLRDHLNDLDAERASTQKELDQVIAALMGTCLNENTPNPTE